MDDFNEGVDGKLASRMRKVNQEQFLTLVKMHLSFELDLNTEDNDCVNEKAKLKKWGLPSFAKKPKAGTNAQRSTDGASLTVEGINRVKQLIEYLSDEQNIVQEGIFRRTGKLTRQQDLKAALYQGLPLELEDGPYSVHDCASVLKSFLAELPEPLLTELHYPAHCQIAELCTVDSSATETRLLSALQLLLLLLPAANRTLLRHVLNLLNKTAAFESSNKMNCDSLATLFTPHLMCPRKLSPEALHFNSQHLSGLVAFMVRRGAELFEIPAKLATDIRAYWVEQERKLLSPSKNDLNESISDATGTAHTVFSFVDHKLTAKANSTQDTQAALAQLYAHIQAMPESTKKRRLVKQFNKENGQGTPRHVKQYRTKSLGDSIKKHIFQKKLLGHKKQVDINTAAANISRSSSDENILVTTRYKDGTRSEKRALSSKIFFCKSDDELSTDSYNNSLENEKNYLEIRRMSSSTGSLDTPHFDSYKSIKGSPGHESTSFGNISEEQIENATDEDEDDEHSRQITSNIFAPLSNGDVYTPEDNSFVEFHERSIEQKSTKMSGEHQEKSISNDFSPGKYRFTRCSSEPPNINSTVANRSKNFGDLLRRKNSESTLLVGNLANITILFSPEKSRETIEADEASGNTPGQLTKSHEKNLSEKMDKISDRSSPIVKNKFWNVYAAHTSTPSDLLRRNVVNADHMLTPITHSDKSMSPITQSTTKMTKAMQETMMTPRSRKPVMMISGSNLCTLASMDKSLESISRSTVRDSNAFETSKSSKNCNWIVKACSKMELPPSRGTRICHEEGIKRRENQIQMQIRENKENLSCLDRPETLRNYPTVSPPLVDDSISITSTFREYLLSRSVLTASPVDLSFTSRTGDFSENSDLNSIINEEGLSDSLLNCLDGNNPSSDTSGIASASTGSANNSTDKAEEIVSLSPRKRGTSLQRHDSKRSSVKSVQVDDLRQMRHKQLSESTLNSAKTKENVQETSF